MFIERATPKDSSSLQRSETDAGVTTIAGNIALRLERGSWITTGFYKHWAPLDKPTWLRPWLRYVMCVASSKVLVVLTKFLVMAAKGVPNGLHLELRGAISLTPWLQPGD